MAADPQVLTNGFEQQINKNLYVLPVYCKCKSDVATWTDAVINQSIDGEIVCVDTIPGAAAPTAGYDPVLKNNDGVDVMGGALGNRSATAAERAYPLSGAVVVKSPVKQCLTVSMSGNSVNAADWTMNIYYEKEYNEA
jgi:hypothetical protein